MIGDLKFVYSGAWRYLLACPLLFAVTVWSSSSSTS